MKLKKIARLPKLYTANNDISKNWHVEYAYLDPVSKKLNRFRDCGNINEFNTADERIAAAQNLIEDYTRKLKSGWNPYKDDVFIYDSIAYEKSIVKRKRANFTIEQYLTQSLTSIIDGLRHKTVKKYQGQLRVFCAWLEENKLAKIHINNFDIIMAEKFIKQLKSPTTKNDYISRLKFFWESFIEKEIAEKNPWKYVKKVPEDRKGLLAFNKFQINELKQYMEKNNPQLLLFCMFQYYCFIRPGELRLLKIKCIDFDAQTLTVPVEVSKNRKKQTVWIPDSFFKELIKLNFHKQNADYFIFTKNNCPGEKKVSINYFSNLHREIILKFNYGNNYALYSWKHTGAKALATSGANIKELQMQLRHSDLETTDIYLKSLGIIEFSKIKTSFPEI